VKWNGLLRFEEQVNKMNLKEKAPWKFWKMKQLNRIEQ